MLTKLDKAMVALGYKVTDLHFWNKAEKQAIVKQALRSK